MRSFDTKIEKPAENRKLNLDTYDINNSNDDFTLDDDVKAQKYVQRSKSCSDSDISEERKYAGLLLKQNFANV